MEEGIFKEINGAMKAINSKSFVVENWRSVKKRLQKEHPTAKITYRKGCYTVTYPAPSDFLKIIGWGLNPIRTAEPKRSRDSTN